MVAQGDIENALADCNQAIRLEPKNATAYEIRGTIWQQWDNEEKALTDWTTAIRLDPKQLMAHFYLARHWNSGRQLEKAISEYGKVLQIDPKFLDVESRRGDLVELKAANDKTITECDQAIAADLTDANAYRRRGIAWIVRGERDKAIADWTAAIRLSPQDASAYKTRGSARLAAGQYDGAIDDWSKVIELQPDQPMAYTNRAYAWSKKGAIDKGARRFERGNSAEQLRCDGTQQSGVRLEEKGRYHQAIADYAEAIRRDRDCGEAYLGLAEIHAACPDARYRNGRCSSKTQSRRSNCSGEERVQFLVAAAAYAEFADFESACKWQELAIRRAPEQSKAKYRAVLRSISPTSRCGKRR